MTILCLACPILYAMIAPIRISQAADKITVPYTSNNQRQPQRSNVGPSIWGGAPLPPIPERVLDGIPGFIAWLAPAAVNSQRRRLSPNAYDGRRPGRPVFSPSLFACRHRQRNRQPQNTRMGSHQLASTIYRAKRRPYHRLGTPFIIWSSSPTTTNHLRFSTAASISLKPSAMPKPKYQSSWQWKAASRTATARPKSFSVNMPAASPMCIILSIRAGELARCNASPPINPGPSNGSSTKPCPAKTWISTT